MSALPTLEDMAALERPSDPTISPDGCVSVHVVTTVDSDTDVDVRRLWVSDAVGTRPLTSGENDSAPRFSPDGRQLAFLRTVDGSAQIHLMNMTGPGEPEAVTSLPLGAGVPVWHPQGTSLAFAAPVDRDGGDDEDADAAAHRRATAPCVIDRLGYKSDGSGLLGGLSMQLHIVDLETGSVRRLTDVDGHLGEPRWHPDGTRLVTVGALAPDADRTYCVEAWTVTTTADRVGTLDRVGPAGAMLAHATWLPDGESLLLVGSESPGVGHLHLLRTDAAEPSTVRNLSAALDRNVMPGGPGYPGALPAVVGTDVLFCARDRGDSLLYRVPLDGSASPEPVLAPDDGQVSGLSVAGGAGTAVAVLGRRATYPELARIDLGDGSVDTITGHGSAALGERRPAEVTDREFTISDGTTVHGFLLRPKKTSGPTPLLLDIHGGPHNAWSPSADHAHAYHQLLVDRGWSVLMLNPRASDGYGEAHFTATVGGWGHVDQADFLEPVQTLVAEGLADGTRLAVTGYSYGGFMTCWLTSHSDVFAAAVAGGVVTETTSLMSSDLGVPALAWELGGVPWAARDALRAQSPFESVQHVRTPTLILHGAADERCPAGQAELWFTALRARAVPARLILYPGAGHLFILDGRPSHRRDYAERLVDWLDTHVPTTPDTKERP